MRRLVLTILLSAATSIASAADLMFPAPTRASGAAHAVIAPGVAEQDYFWLTEAYPSSTAMDHYGHLFEKWHRCRSRQEGWVSFGDLTTRPPRFVHQLARSWVNSSNDTAVTVSLRYQSSGEDARPAPENDHQFVFVLRPKM